MGKSKLQQRMNDMKVLSDQYDELKTDNENLQQQNKNDATQKISELKKRCATLQEQIDKNDDNKAEVKTKLSKALKAAMVKLKQSRADNAKYKQTIAVLQNGLIMDEKSTQTMKQNEIVKEEEKCIETEASNVG